MDSDINNSFTSINNIMIVPLCGEMTDDNTKELLENVTESVYKYAVKGVILNFTAVDMLDSFLFISFKNLTSALNLLGVQTVWVGLKPGVVSALIDLGIDIDLKKISTAVNLDEGLAKIKN